jgi:hypothetical protein
LPRIQEAHILAGHILCEILELELTQGSAVVGQNGVGLRSPLPSRSL